jgi:glutathione S-transferase
MNESTITVSRNVSAPVDRVFDAWTDEARLAAWWWPHLAGTTYDVDARSDGRYRIVSPVIGATVSGEYSEVDRPRRLAFTWNWQDDEEPESLVEDSVVVTFEPHDDETIVTVAHTSAAHAPDGGTEQGWSDVLDRLVRLLDQSTSSRS